MDWVEEQESSKHKIKPTTEDMEELIVYFEALIKSLL